jgi:hypothetical protein
LQLDISLPAANRAVSLWPTGGDRRGGKVSRVEPTPPGADPTGSEGSAGRCDRCGRCLGFRGCFRPFNVTSN